MSAIAGEDEKVFNSVKDKAIYWENRSKAFEAQVKKLQAKRQVSTEDEHPVKKLRMESVNMDPLACFPYHITQLIMNHFNGMDFDMMTKVSKEWEAVVENDPKAAYKLKDTLTLNTRRNKEEVCLKLLSDIEFKYLTVNSDLLGKKLLNRFSSTIESLDIYPSATNDISHELLEGLAFPRLKLLRVAHYESNLLEWLANCEFPALNELILAVDGGCSSFKVYNVHVMKKTLAAMPNLKHLYLGTLVVKLEPFKEEFSKLESLQVLMFFDDDDFIKAFSSSTLLKTLGTNFMTEREGNLIFANMKNLKNLQTRIPIDLPFYGLLPAEIEMTINTNIITLDVAVIYHHNTNQNTLLVEKMLKALPSLEKFRYCEELLPSTLDVIVRNNLKLKKLFCAAAFEETLKKKYEELKMTEAENDQINKSIEIVNYSLWWMED